MALNTQTPPPSLATLRRFVRKAQVSLERCELCSAPLPPNHQHLLELEKRQLTCACDACAILFGGNARQRYRRIPRDVQRLTNFAMDDFEWESLLIPINLAYFVKLSETGKTVAQYPSPGGAMESSLDLEYWSLILERNPLLKSFEPNIEALLVNRIAKPVYFRAPIDHCYRLVGLIRKHWRGLSGGTEVWREIDKFFKELDAMSSEAQIA
jgi:Family of unknown function (DUF5947)